MERSSGDGSHVLVVCVPYPRECAEDTDGDGEVGDNAHDQDSVVVVLMVNEDESYTEDKPDETRRCAARVDAAKMLEYGSATKPPPQGRPLRKLLWSARNRL